MTDRSMNAFTNTLRGVLVVAIMATFYVTASTHTSPLAPYAVDGGQTDVVEYAAIRTAQPDNAPTWADVAADFPACAVLKGQLVDQVIVVHQDGTASRMSFDEAWGRGQDKAWGNDVWTVGGCS